jgi:hypothetical protein
MAMTIKYTHSKQQQLFINALIFLGVLNAFEAPFASMFKMGPNWISVTVDSIISIMFLIDGILLYKRELPHGKKSAKRFLILSIISSIPIELILFIGIPVTPLRFLRLVRAYRFIPEMKRAGLLSELAVIPFKLKIALAAVSAFFAMHFISCLWPMVEPKYVNESIADQYVNSMYWSITTLTTVGYGDITPSSNMAKIFTMFVMVLGVGMYGFVIGNISQLLSDRNRYREKAREKIEDLQTFMKHYNVPRKVQVDTLDYVNTLLGKRLSDNDGQIIADLPNALQEELTMFMNIKLISSLTIFDGIGALCLKQVARKLKKKSFSPGQKIINKGDSGNEMYIINHGKVDVRSEKQSLVVLDDGMFFGEQALIKHTTRNADVISMSYCDLYILEKDDFMGLIDMFPELIKNMDTTLNEIQEHLNEIKQKNQDSPEQKLKLAS